MITLRPSQERGHFDHGWLKTFHSFSFGDYFSREHRNFRSLRVINEDWVAPAEGFDPHGHERMEIITYVLEGALEHKDSMGNGSLIRPHDAQYMSAGTGVTHSEFNASQSEPVHLLQIWILPDPKTFAEPPRYAQSHFEPLHKKNQLCLIASPTGRQGSLSIRQDADLYASLLSPSQQIAFTPRSPERGQWIQLISGSISVNEKQILTAGDGAKIEAETALILRAQGQETAHFLLFDLA